MAQTISPFSWANTIHQCSSRKGRTLTSEIINTAKATRPFAEAVKDLANHWKDIPDPKEHAIALAHASAVLAARIEDIIEETELDEEYEDRFEHVTGNHAIQRAQDILRETAQNAADALQQAGIMPQNEEHLKHSEQAEFATAVIVAGQAAATESLLDRLDEYDVESEYACGTVLALWGPMEDIARELPITESTNPGIAKAAAAAAAAQDRAFSVQMLNLMEMSRGYFISKAAIDFSKQRGAEAYQGLTSHLWGNGTYSEALYEWHTEDDLRIVMAYRYEGCGYVKMFDEPYEHPIDFRTALEHCDELETAAIELDDPEGPTDRRIMKAALRRRAMVLAGLHQTPESMIREAVQTITRLAGNAGAAAIMPAITDNFAELSQMTQELGAVPQPTPHADLPWDTAERILLAIHELRDLNADQWQAAVRATGHDPQGEKAASLRKLISDDED